MMIVIQLAQDKIIYNPFSVQAIIFALSDHIRIQILKYLSQTSEADTSTISKIIKKATNTTLYHLNVLHEAELITSAVKRKKGRDLYHWSLKKGELLLYIDMDLFVSKEHSLDTYMLRILIYYRDQNQLIGKDFRQNIDLDELGTLLGVDPQLINAIIEKMDVVKITDIIYRKIYSDLMDYRKSEEAVRLDQWDIQRDWNLDEEIALSIFYKLLQTGKFSLDQKNHICSLKLI